MDLSASSERQIEVGVVAGVGVEDSGSGIERRHEIVAKLERRKSRPHLACAQQLVGKPVILRAAKRAHHDLAIRWANHQAAGGSEQRSIGQTLELAPQLERTPHQWHVEW